MPASAPLADRLRPRTLGEFLGQRHLVGVGKPLQELLAKDAIPSLIFWGPPGSGKTTLARIIANQTRAKFHHLSAVLSGIGELREIVGAIEKERGGLSYSANSPSLLRAPAQLALDVAGHHILFMDEIHRWNKVQQDALLPYVEDGTMTLIGATTENPSFEVIGPLLSRCKVYVLEPLSEGDLRVIVERGLKELGRELTPEALSFVIQTADGDARRALNTIEIAAAISYDSTSVCQYDGKNKKTDVPSYCRTIVLSDIEAALQRKSLLYDKKGEGHYNVISAFIKSMRDSNPDAAIYYLARMYEAGEDPRFIARRMVIFASEDIGNADPEALRVAVAAFQAYEIVGQAEGWIPLAQAAAYLARAPKSNESYMAYKRAKADVEAFGTLPTPLNLRNAPTALMKELGYGKGYAYAHSQPKEARQAPPSAAREANSKNLRSKITQQHLPDKLKGKKYF